MTPNVLLTFPHAGNVRTEFMMSVRAAEKSLKLIGDVYARASGPTLTITRSDIASYFLKQKWAEWLWMVDTDMVFNRRTLPLLMQAADPVERPVVGALAMTIVEDELRPSAYLVRREPSFGFSPLAEWPQNTLCRVDAVGAACTLIHRSVFDRITEYDPDIDGLWFTELTVERQAMGEDFSFCLRCALADIPVFVHTGVRVGHVKPIMLGTVTP